jgi:hypothetical protein
LKRAVDALSGRFHLFEAEDLDGEDTSGGAGGDERADDADSEGGGKRAFWIPPRGTERGRKSDG